MLTRTLARLSLRLPAAGAGAGAASARASSQWLQGRAPSSGDIAPNTFGAFYYANMRECETPTRDLVIAPGQDEKFNVGQFDKEVFAFANGFAEGLGLQRGTKVALWMTNELEHLAVQAAASLTGATVVSIDPALPWDAVMHILQTEAPRVLIVSPRAGAEDRAAALAEHFAPELARFGAGAAAWGYEPLESKRFRSLKYIVQTGFDDVPGVVSLADLVAMGTDGAYEVDMIAAMQSAVAPGDAATVQFSRAATGGQALERRVVSNAQLLATAAAAAAAMRLKRADVVLLTAPLYSHFSYAAGALAAVTAGAKIVLPSKQFDAAAALSALTAQRATHLVCTPEQASEMAAVLAQDAATGAYSTASLRGGMVLAEAGASIGGVPLRPVSPALLHGATAKL